MVYIDRILFPTDGSKCAEWARRHAMYLADHFDAVLHVVQVDERDVDPTDVIDVREADVLADLHDTEAVSSVLAEARVRGRTVSYASAAGGILTYAVEHDSDLIVLGTHGHRGVRRLILGSVAEEVVRKAPCPVVTVGRGALAPDAMEGGEMLVPIDFSEHRSRLLAHAREIAPIYDMAVTLLHVVEVYGQPDAYGTYESAPDPRVPEDRAEQVLDEEAEALREKGLDVSIEAVGGHPAEQVLTVAEDREVAFIVIATHGRTGMDRMLMGSVAEKIIRQAPCPIYTVKSFGTSLVDDENGSKGASSG